ncbi:hypothetical protein BC827DRAFT_1270680 [Russula dissimulans]|nr:hypothetical protein BC827DRAFT_1270680 [Russula dissimulans]
MSNIPTVTDPQILVDSLLNSIETATTASAKLHLNSALATLLSHSTFKTILGKFSFINIDDNETAPSPPTDNLSSLNEIKFSLSLLAKAIASLQASPPPIKLLKTPNMAKFPLAPPKKTFTAIAGIRALNPSLVIALSHLQLPPGERPSPVLITATLNSQLPLLYHQKHLQQNTPGILPSHWKHHPQGFQATLFRTFSPPIRPNMRWSKLLIHGVPTNVSKDRGPSSPKECHEALYATNPSYSSLLITYKPFWVYLPSSYKPGSVSSLVVAFEDPDRSVLRSLTQAKYLYIFGTQAKAGDSTDKEDIITTLNTPPHRPPEESTPRQMQVLPPPSPKWQPHTSPRSAIDLQQPPPQQQGAQGSDFTMPNSFPRP